MILGWIWHWKLKVHNFIIKNLLHGVNKYTLSMSLNRFSFVKWPYMHACACKEGKETRGWKTPEFVFLFGRRIVLFDIFCWQCLFSLNNRMVWILQFDEGKKRLHFVSILIRFDLVADDEMISTRGVHLFTFPNTALAKKLYHRSFRCVRVCALFFFGSVNPVSFIRIKMGSMSKENENPFTNDFDSAKQ